MKRLFLWLVFFAVLGIQSALAQAYKIKGTVVSETDKEPLIGVSIQQKGTTNGVVTDIDGNYELQVKGGSATLVFSYIGMRSQEHVVTDKTGVLNVTLEDDSHMVDEVVVVAYGVRKKGTIAGSVSTVKADKLENVPTAGFDQALQGQTPGLSVISSSGEPSETAQFKIRGTNSINSGTAPLFILDGVPISSSDFNTINPNDIESVSVLKDASSTSIYGARAANGVVVITTKRGRNTGGAKVSLRAQWGYSQLAGNNWDVMNTAERIQFEKEVGLDAGEDYYNKVRGVDVNWKDMVYKNNAPLQSYELNVSGATEKTNYFVSGGYFTQDGITIGSGLSRYTLRANVENRAKEWLKLGTNTMLTYEEIEQAVEGSYALYSPISAAQFMLPYWNPYNADGTIASQNNGQWKGSGQNPIEWMNNNPQTHDKYKVLSTVFAEVSPIKGLTIRSQFGVDYTHSKSFMQSFPSYIINNSYGSAGRLSSDVLNLTVTNTVNYRFNLDGKHDFNFMLGQEGINYQTEGFQVVTRGQNNDKLTNVTSGINASTWSDNYSDYAYLSFFGRGEYHYDDRYYADFSVRTDASSRFGKSGRWAGFWSVGFMWNARKEEFLSDIDWLSNAQVTLSTGTTGNSEIPNYDHLALVSGGSNYMGEAGIAPSQRGNEDLSWESTWSTNFGIRLGFLDKYNLTVEAYNKRTSNMLMLVPESYANGGYGSYWDNVGVMVNRGIEFSADAVLFSNKDWTWSVNANASFNRNKLLELYNGVTEYTMSTTGIKYMIGHSVSEFYLPRYAGVNPANGDALWYKPDGTITNEFSEDYKVMTGKKFDADWQGGFGTTVSWKGLTLSAQFSWIGEHWVFNNDRLMAEGNGLYTSYNQSKRLLYDRWKKPGDITDIPRYGITPQFDTRFLENAAFLRLKNLMISYNIPQEWMSKTRFFNMARVYVQGQNLLTFTDFSGIDPEVAGNLYQANYPMTRQFSFGVELNF